MGEESFEITPRVALDFAQTLFIELAVALNKQGALPLTVLAKAITAAADESKNEPGRRDVGIALSGVAQALTAHSKAGPE